MSAEDPGIAIAVKGKTHWTMIIAPKYANSAHVAIDPPEVPPMTPGPTIPDPPSPTTPDPAPGPKPSPGPLPGTPSITPREVPNHPGQQPQPAKEHPADPKPQQPTG